MHLGWTHTAPERWNADLRRLQRRDALLGRNDPPMDRPMDRPYGRRVHCERLIASNDLSTGTRMCVRQILWLHAVGETGIKRS